MSTLKKSISAFAVLIFTLTACESESYSSGEGELSYLRADMVMAHTATAKTVDKAWRDDGTLLQLNPYATAEWMTTPDSLYRALLYYNNVSPAEPVAIRQVYVLRWSGSVATATQSDPLSLVSMWKSENNEWMNLALDLKTGVVDSLDSVQKIGVSCDSVVQKSDATHVWLRLLHDQNGVPEYYTQRIYVSLPIESNSGTVYHLTIPDRSGAITKTY